MERASGYLRSLKPQKLTPSRQPVGSAWLICVLSIFITLVNVDCIIVNNSNDNGNYPVVLVVGNHDEEVHGISLLCTLGYKHVLWPSAPAEVELIRSCEIISVGPILVDVAEGCLEGNCNGGLDRVPGDSVLTSPH